MITAVITSIFQLPKTVYCVITAVKPSNFRLPNQGLLKNPAVKPIKIKFLFKKILLQSSLCVHNMI
jgi:hypothetical protein